MDTINISLPSQLKNKADELIDRGHFASFSDLVRTALRQVISDSEYDLMAQGAILEHKRGKSKTLATGTEIDNYIKTVVKS